MAALETDWLQAVIRAVRPLIPPGFWGHIKLNCQAGSISNVNVEQSVKAAEAEDSPTPTAAGSGTARKQLTTRVC